MILQMGSFPVMAPNRLVLYLLLPQDRQTVS